MRAASIAAAILAAAVAASAGAAFIPKMPDFVRGADVSSITEMEKRGDRVSSALGVEADGFRIMREFGVEAVRLDVLVNPSGDGWCAARDTLDKATRARMAGLQVMLAFHYSDVYATAERQEIPGVWSNLDAAGLSRAVYMHTAQVLALMKRNHIVPLWVQVGNAVNDGFLWPAARMSENPKVFADVFESGYKAVKAVFPKTAVLIHFDRGHDFGLFDRNLSLLRKHHVPWDVAACSVFPSKCREERPDADKLLMDILDVLKKVGYDFNCDTMIAELGLECSPETYTESRRRLTALLFEASKVRRCRGVFYYEPMLRKGDAGNPLGAFDGRGFPTPIMEGFRPVYRNF
ncbi:MAG: glycosyl hydrolase 53 family protein [Kiritimatiellae bacterium]|nr:glycosyl hydrolase 53 family protein [Kiritimatiellia bacterium]